ncbi:hypothetical protein FACS1894200_05160 [Spirochaetia bacterium]|nr:hypothetical protein FACS1894200_05160 [Spirochaetia bacterium]
MHFAQHKTPTSRVDDVVRSLSVPWHRRSKLDSQWEETNHKAHLQAGEEKRYSPAFLPFVSFMLTNS